MENTKYNFILRPTPIQDLIQKHYERIGLRIDEQIKIALEKCEPKIKGEITRGKLKWRGIILEIYDNYDLTSKTYKIKQRGVLLDEFKVDFQLFAPTI